MSRDSLQPANGFDAGEVTRTAEELKHLDGALLPILHAINDRFGYIDDRAIPLIAEVLNLSRADVHGVVGFYHDFRRAPAGRHVVKVCRGEACQSMGAERVVERLERELGVDLGGTTADGRVTIEEVFCLGNCALSPALLVDGQPHGRADEDRAAAIVRGVDR